jgi:biopolymer transport protein TolQ
VFLEASPLLLAFLLQVSLWEAVLVAEPFTQATLVILLIFWGRFRHAKRSSKQFLRAFRKANALDAVAIASEQFRASPLVTVFDFGYAEVERQVKARGMVGNKLALERTLQLGMSEEIARLEYNMNWLATAATVSPFIGLFGTVLGIIHAFQGLGQAGSASLRAVAPGISEALIATAMGLAAAIPAAIFYNYFGNQIKEFGARMEDFSLEFLNLTEQKFED